MPLVLARRDAPRRLIQEKTMTKTEKSKLPDVCTSGHPGGTISTSQLNAAAAHQVILGPTRTGMGAGPILPQVLDLARKPKR